jgi:hypothetical protein
MIGDEALCPVEQNEERISAYTRTSLDSGQ